MRTAGWLASAAIAMVVAGCASTETTPTREQKQALAPTAKLRAGFNSTNPIYVTKDAPTGELSGIVVDLGKELARRLGVPFESVPFPSIGALVTSARSGQWDVAFLSIDPARTKDMDFSPPYMEVEAGYLVAQGSSISTMSDVDKPSVRIVVQEKGGADVFLTSALKVAQLVRVPTFARATELLKSGQVDAFAALKPALFASSRQLPGSRVLDGRFSVEEICIAVPKGHDLSMSYVRKFVEEAKAEGIVKAAIDKAGLRGVVTAPYR